MANLISKTLKICDNMKFYDQGPHSDFSGPTSGSTACVAVIRNNQLVVANAGDSRCVISRKGQVCSQINPSVDVSSSWCLKLY